VTAATAIFWLKNRQPQKWRDRVVSQIVVDNEDALQANLDKNLSELRCIRPTPWS